MQVKITSPKLSNVASGRRENYSRLLMNQFGCANWRRDYQLIVYGMLTIVALNKPSEVAGLYHLVASGTTTWRD